MSIENTPDSTSNEQAFEVDEAAFFGQNDEPTGEQEDETNSSEEDTEIEETADATETDEDTDGVDTPEDEDTEEDEAPEEEPAPKPRKNRLQERIDELTAGRYDAERRANDLEAKLNDVLAKLEKAKEDTPAASKPVASVTGPQPDDKNEDGTEKYPLGEFDPQYIRDLTRHTIAEESKAVKEREDADREASDLRRQEVELATAWTQKLEEAAASHLPNIKETNAALESTFRDLDPAYGKYLAATIMSMEFGPDVLDYLGNNLDEAKRIVNLGATKATLALGSLESKYRVAEAEKQVAKPRVSKAPTPPPQNKGSAAAKPAVSGDTDDFGAFLADWNKKSKKA